MGLTLKLKDGKEIDAFEYLKQVVDGMELSEEEKTNLYKDIKEIAENEDGISYIQHRINEKGYVTRADINMAHIWGPGEGAVLGI